MADMAYQVFVDLDATALEGGSIYLGVANDDPEQNPIPVYWDQALTVLATQPLRTSGGVIVRDGTPSDVFANVAAYSIRVRNRAGKVVWYKPTTGGTSTSRLSFPIPTGPAGEMGDTGPTGPANSTYTSLTALKAAPQSNRSYILADGTNSPVTYAYVAGDFTGRADDVNVVKLDAVPLTTGALVRQTAVGVNFDGRSTDAKLREEVSVKDGRFGAKGDATVTYAADGSVATITGTDDTAAINAALAGGGRVKVPRGTYRITGRLLVTVPNTELVLEAGVLIAGTPWRYNGQQLPFGAAVLITATNCSVTGAGMGLSTIALTGGSEANAITFLHCDGGYAGYLTLDGGMAAVTSVEDDTFMTGINVLNATGGNPSGKHTRVTVEKVEARRWTQYGLQAYGDLAGVDFVECHVHHNGILDQPHSRGAGIAVTRGNRNVTIRGCTIEDNKQDGIFQTSAGLDSFDLAFTDNVIRRNGRFGITCTEESNFASVAGVGTNGIIMKGNKIRENGNGTFDTKGGLRIGTFDGVGRMLNVTSTDDIQDNTGFGVIIFTNDNPTNRTSNVNIDGKVSGNTANGIGLGAKLDDTVRYNGTKIRGNPGGDIGNFGDSRLVSNSRGQGASIASAGTITIPADGDTFVLTGSTTVTSITPDPGRTVTLVFGGSITVARTGNVVMAADFAGQGNSTLQLTCIGGSWFKIAGSMNA